MSAEPIVLIVDDNVELLQLLLTTLPPLGGFQVVGAPDGVTGLELAYTLHPVCMVIDVRMPGLDGLQLVRALRGDAETASIPLIILTALAQDRDSFAGFAAGTDQYLTKPVTPQELVAVILRAMTLTETERAQRYQALADDTTA